MHLYSLPRYHPPNLISNLLIFARSVPAPSSSPDEVVEGTKLAGHIRWPSRKKGPVSISCCLTIRALLRSPISRVITRKLPRGAFIYMSNIVRLDRNTDLLIKHPMSTRKRRAKRPLVRVPLSGVSRLHTISARTLEQKCMARSISSATE